jgi:hypothetical protein
VAAAAAIRRLGALLLAMEHPHPTVDAMIAKFGEWEGELAVAAARDRAPRIGAEADDPRRVNLNHATDIGAYTPAFPGPPGLVHGGFLAVFFDCVIQHHNCVAGLSGKTRSLGLTFRRPTPLLTELRFDIARSPIERGIASTARLLLDDEVLCVGEVKTLASPPERLSAFQFGRRRKESET